MVLMFEKLRARLDRANVPALTTDELAALQQSGDVFVVDVGARGRFHSALIPGAVRLAALQFGREALPDNQRMPLVFYGDDAVDGARRAMRMGQKAVFVLPDGIDGWSCESRLFEKCRG